MKPRHALRRAGSHFFIPAERWGRYCRTDDGRRRLMGARYVRIEAPRRVLLTCWLLGECHVGGAVECWGTWKAAGWAGVSAGVLEHVETEKRGGRLVAVFRLSTFEHPAIADLAARCADAMRSHTGTPESLDPDRVPDVAEGPRWPDGARACPACACTPSDPCPVVLDDGCGTGACAPAGLFGALDCSACSGNAVRALEARRRAEAPSGPP